MSLLSSKIFNNFIVGKAIDSFDYWYLMLCWLFNIPISLCIAAVCVCWRNEYDSCFWTFYWGYSRVVILFIIHPITAVYFALFVFALQQFDGNVLGPMILGDKLGLQVSVSYFRYALEEGCLE